MKLEDSPDWSEKNQNRSDSLKITQDELRNLVIYNPDTGAFLQRCHVPHSGRRAGQNIALERDGKMVVHLKQHQYRAARLAFLYMTGYIPKYVRHLNGNPRDLRWVNLAGLEEIPKPAEVGRELDRDAYTPRRVNCDHCKNSWIAQFDLAVSWLKCQHCQRVLRGEDLRKQIKPITLLGGVPRQ